MFFLNGAVANTWDFNEDPLRLSSSYQYRFEALPLNAKISNIPWSDTYWPDHQGSINYRWNTPNPIGFDFSPPTHEQVLAMNRDEISSLSPAEKYDLLMGQYDFPLFNEVRQSPQVTKNAPIWNGICDGWAMASVQFPEPKATDQMNPDGMVIPFGSSDIKAILSYAMSYHFRAFSVKAGLPFSSNRCSGINAGTFHIALTNQIGLLNESLIMDRSTTFEIWNQAIYEYHLSSIGSATPESGMSGVRVQGAVYFADELEKPSYSSVGGTPRQRTTKVNVDYILDLDGAGQVIGGRYLNRSFRPDYLWFPRNTFTFDGYFIGLAKLTKN